jgi:hypothetical protein
MNVAYLYEIWVKFYLTARYHVPKDIDFAGRRKDLTSKC